MPTFLPVGCCSANKHASGPRAWHDQSFDQYTPAEPRLLETMLVIPLPPSMYAALMPVPSRLASPRKRPGIAAVRKNYVQRPGVPETVGQVAPTLLRAPAGQPAGPDDGVRVELG